MTPRVTIDQSGGSLELTAWVNEQAGVSILVSAAEWTLIVAKAEQIPAVREYRATEARLAHSHGARG